MTDEPEWRHISLDQKVKTFGAGEPYSFSTLRSVTHFPLKDFTLELCGPDHLNKLAEQNHYMHRPIHMRSSPFGWIVGYKNKLFHKDGRPFGFVIYATPHYTKLKGEFGYPELPTKWQVLMLSRFWLHPDFQAGGNLFSEKVLPGFRDRKGIFRSALASTLITESFRHVQKRWIEVHPPRFIEQPYHIVKIISYCDTRYFSGNIYNQAGFRKHGETKSQARHKNTRGSGMDGANLIRFIRDLPEPDWKYEPEPDLQMEF